MSIKFIKYTGEYPNLCSGLLVLEIDGEVVEFNGYEEIEIDSGGMCFPEEDWDTEYGPWIIEVTHPLYKHLSKEIEDIFNANVPYGCCGGCI